MFHIPFWHVLQFILYNYSIIHGKKFMGMVDMWMTLWSTNSVIMLDMWLAGFQQMELND